MELITVDMRVLLGAAALLFCLGLLLLVASRGAARRNGRRPASSATGDPGAADDIAVELPVGRVKADLRDVSFEADALVDEPTGAAAFALEVAGKTDRGQRRARNEDSMLVLDEASVFAVADGMGGHAGGALASRLAVDVIRRAFTVAPASADQDTTRRIPAAAAELVTAIAAANAVIRKIADERDIYAEMGTTVVAARFCERKQRLYVSHVGDSRCYRLRGGRLRLLTADHTMANLGVTGRAAAYLSRAVGIAEVVQPDVTVVRPDIGDVFVLCSDGLTKMMPDEAIAEVVAGAPDVESAADELVRRANQCGGMDNITAIVIRVLPRAA